MDFQIGADDWSCELSGLAVAQITITYCFG